MNPIGPLIEARRQQLGLSRDTVAQRLGVTVQTVLNIERDAGYNIGIRTLQNLEAVLQVEFHLTTKEQTPMKKRIRMGSDELIYHIRKHYSCDKDNPTIGRMLEAWLSAHANGRQLAHQYATPYMIGLDADAKIPAVSRTNLPKGSVIFEFDLDALPALYECLAEWGGQQREEGDYVRV